MNHFFAYWWHHSNNFPNGLTLGLPLFAWNRIAKVFLFFSAWSILLDIIGVERIEHWFTERHEKFSARLDWFDAWRLKGTEGLTHDLLLQIALIRHLFSRKTTVEKLILRQPSRTLAIILLLLLVISAGVATFVS